LAKGSNFAVAQVIDRIAPTSGKVGDKALILDTGELIGWIGGGCVRGIMIKEALEVRSLDVVADQGYYSREEIKSCVDGGVVPYIQNPPTSEKFIRESSAR